MRATFKCPDALEFGIKDLVDCEALIYCIDKDKEETKYWKEDKIKELKELCSKWVGYGEYITVEFDFLMNTCVVIPQR
jgi:hypothetical protein